MQQQLFYHKVICSLYTCGSVSETNEFKRRKVNTRTQVRLMINETIDLLKNLGVNDTVSNIKSNRVIIIYIFYSKLTFVKS